MMTIDVTHNELGRSARRYHTACEYIMKISTWKITLFNNEAEPTHLLWESICPSGRMAAVTH